MTKSLFIAVLIIIGLSSFIQSDIMKSAVNSSFQKGEHLMYKAAYGMFTVGRGSLKIQNNSIEMHGRPTYQVDVIGKTSGFVDFVASVNDHWKSYVDTTTLVTYMAMRNLKEGGYRKIDITEFFHQDSLIKVKDMDFDKGTFGEAQEFKMEGVTRGMISGFLHMRTLDFTRLLKGDTITLKSFLDDTFYDLQVVFYKREILDTKAGSFKSVVFRPVMPDNSIFEGEDAILAWFSDDENKIPLKVEAKMFIGHAGIELTEFSGLRNKPALVDD